MTGRLEARLGALRAAGGRGLAPYVTAGDGGLATTLAVLRALDGAGATCVELGLPFSDPIADGPVLQAAAQRALEAGTSLEGVLELLRALRAGDAEHPPSALPVVLMTYANPLVRRGWDAACRALAAAGADGVLVADLPVEEGAPLRAAALAAGLCPIFFAAPTTSDARLAAAARASRGFLYAIGRFGVTGAATDLGADAQRFLERARAVAGELPVAVGFGIGTPAQVAAAVRHADLAIVGSALVAALHAAAGDLPERERPAAAARAATRVARELCAGLPAATADPPEVP